MPKEMTIWWTKGMLGMLALSLYRYGHVGAHLRWRGGPWSQGRKSV